MDYEGEFEYMKSSPGASQTEDFAEAWGNTSTAAALETKQDVRVMAHDRVAQAAAHEARAMAQRDLKMEAQRPPDAKPPPRRSTREKTEKRQRVWRGG